MRRTGRFANLDLTRLCSAHCQENLHPAPQCPTYILGSSETRTPYLHQNCLHRTNCHTTITANLIFHLRFAHGEGEMRLCSCDTDKPRIRDEHAPGWSTTPQRRGESWRLKRRCPSPRPRPSTAARTPPSRHRS
jgi:hypothetical protein